MHGRRTASRGASETFGEYLESREGSIAMNVGHVRRPLRAAAMGDGHAASSARTRRVEIGEIREPSGRGDGRRCVGSSRHRTRRPPWTQRPAGAEPARVARRECRSRGDVIGQSASLDRLERVPRSKGSDAATVKTCHSKCTGETGGSRSTRGSGGRSKWTHDQGVGGVSAFWTLRGAGAAVYSLHTGHARSTARSRSPSGTTGRRASRSGMRCMTRPAELS